MPKAITPKDSDEVYEAMKEYCSKKQFQVPNATLRFWAEDCFLYFESRGWKGISYWPAVAMRWCLTNIKKLPKKDISPTKKKPMGKSIRDIILERERVKNGEELPEPDLHGDSYGDR